MNTDIILEMNQTCTENRQYDHHLIMIDQSAILEKVGGVSRRIWVHIYYAIQNPNQVSEPTIIPAERSHIPSRLLSQQTNYSICVLLVHAYLLYYHTLTDCMQ